MAPVSLDAVISQAVVIVRASGESSGARIEVDDLSKLPGLLASEQRLLQIFVNLLSNAVKFTPEGGRVRVRAVAKADEVIISVIDNGIGMTAAEVEQAMLPFTQVDISLERRLEGTGLGLPLAKLLVEGHGGALQIESESGPRTDVIVRLPVVSRSG